jgi:endonuclease/exonuclease/phosphatase family metal-dependent hydrolase
MSGAGRNRSKPPLRRIGTMLVLLLWAVALSGAAAAAPKPDAAADRSDRQVTVMSRNIYLGASLTPLFAAGGVDQLFDAVAEVWEQVEGTDFPTRAEALADEVAEAMPDLIGLQEVTLWRSYPALGLLIPNLAEETVEYDFLALLLSELAERGLAYEAVAGVENFDGIQPAGYAGPFFRLTDRDVILARSDRRVSDLKISNPQDDNFEQSLELSVLGNPLEILRGWASVDVRVRGQQFRFVNTHLEAWGVREDLSGGEDLRVQQVGELLAGPLATDLPVILVGDINSEATGAEAEETPGAAAYLALRAAGLDDPWLALRDGDDGFTCCFDADVAVSDPELLTSRIDVVLASDRFRPRSIDVVGDEVDDMIEGLWPSDHAGVVATLVLDPPRARR